MQPDDLGKRELGVAGARGQVDEKVIQRSPVHIAEKLLDDLGDDGSAPDRRRIALHHQSQGHDLDPVTLQRNDAVPAYRRLLRKAEHAGDVGTIDVRVHQSDAVPVTRQRRGEIRGHGRLPDPALAARNRENLAECRHFVGCRWRWRSGGRTTGWPGGRSGPPPAIGRVDDIHLHTRHTGNAFDRLARLARERPGIFAREHEGERDHAGGVDRDVLHHPGRDDIAAVARTRNSAQRPLDVSFDRQFAHAGWPLARNARATRSTFSSTSAMVPGNDAPAAR